MTKSRPDNLYAEATRILTGAARRENPDGTRCDSAAFLAHVLAATAANVGGPDQLLAGRSGSWEAALVGSLVYGTIGHDPEAMLPYRTEPVVVPLNVAELIEDSEQHPGLLGLDDALAACDDRDKTTDETDAHERERERHGITARYTETYREYGHRFAYAVAAAAAAVGTLHVPVELRADTDPMSRWWAGGSTRNPDLLDCDSIVAKLWFCAHDVVPLPNVIVRVERVPVASAGGPPRFEMDGDRRSAPQEGSAG